MKARSFLFLTAVCFLCGEAESRVFINEIYYDHPGSDGGHEYVELYCEDGCQAGLQGWSLVFIDGRTGSRRILWSGDQGDSTGSGGLFLLGGEHCPAEPGGLLGGTLENGPDALALESGGIVEVVVRYGDGDKACRAGNSLSRLPGGEYRCSAPTPGKVNFHMTDLALEPAGPCRVRCEYIRFDFPLMIINTGLSRFDGGIEVIILTGAGPERAGGTGIGLDPGESCLWSVPHPGLVPGVSMLTAVIEAHGDSDVSNDTVSVTMRASPGEIVINEVMYRPASGGEWIELFNRSTRSVDLSGWVVADRSGTNGTIGSGVSIGPGDYLVLAQDPGSLQSTGLEGSWPRLNDGEGESVAEEIFVISPDGLVEESISYPGMIIGEKGRSIERISPGLCSVGSRGIWLRCGAAAGSTPGKANYSLTGEIPLTGVTVDPDPFRPLVDSRIVFTAAALEGEVSYSARVFDMEGREIARLPSGPIGAPAVTFGWDGRDDSGNSTGTGLYICAVEFMCGGGRVCRREKVVVKVWSGE
jgi:hypothetical protein